jgi:O-antigen ligase
MVFGWLQLRARGRIEPTERSGRVRWLARSWPIAAAAAILVAAISLSRAEALERFLTGSISDDPRALYTPTIVEIAKDFFPVGSGFGSFDPVYRYYEPFELLRNLYLNHAHNDWLELVVTGGLPAVLLALCFVAWAAPRAGRAMAAGHGFRSHGFARLACATIAIMLASSLVDYPLRTPLLGALFALSCGWLGCLDGKRNEPSVPSPAG